MPRKAFRQAIAAEPTGFDLEGRQTGLRYFECRDSLAAGTLMRFAEVFSALDDEDGVDPAQSAKAGMAAIPAVKDFFNSVLKPEGRDPFWAMINSDDEEIGLDTLVDIAGWLSEVYSGGRPTGTTSDDTSEATSSGDASTATPSPAGIQTFSRPEPTPSSTS